MHMRYPRKILRLFKRLLLIGSVLLLFNLYSVVQTQHNWHLAFQPVPFAVDEQQFVSSSHRQACNRMFCTNNRARNENDTSRITVVSAYFNIGTFQKGNTGHFSSSSLYLQWMYTYRLLLNDVIFFTDEETFLETFQDIRNLPLQRTCFCLVRRDALWSFQLQPLLVSVLNQAGYPQHSPNTVLPDYGVVMHSKYALMQLALQWNPFAAQTFAWADIGIFRLLSRMETTEPPFFLSLPSDFDPQRVAFTQVEPPDFDKPVADYFKRNLVWVAGGFFVATRNVMISWVEQYRAATFALLRMGLSDTDQQVIYTMYTPALRALLANRAPLLSVQTYQVQRGDRIDNWFYLPFRSRLEWFRTASHPSNPSQCIHVTVNMKDCDKTGGFIEWLLSLV